MLPYSIRNTSWNWPERTAWRSLSCCSLPFRRYTGARPAGGCARVPRSYRAAALRLTRKETCFAATSQGILALAALSASGPVKDSSITLRSQGRIGGTSDLSVPSCPSVILCLWTDSPTMSREGTSRQDSNRDLQTDHPAKPADPTIGSPWRPPGSVSERLLPRMTVGATVMSTP